jgi:hypothetical protein
MEEWNDMVPYCASEFFLCYSKEKNPKCKRCLPCLPAGWSHLPCPQYSVPWLFETWHLSPTRPFCNMEDGESYLSPAG